MATIIKSHNDYLAKSPVFWAARRGATIFEADIISFFGSIQCAHSWRPSMMCNISFHDYCNSLRILCDFCDNVKYYFQLEIKHGLSKSDIDFVVCEIDKLILKCPNLTIGVFASDNWYGFFRVKSRDDLLKFYQRTTERVMEYGEMIKMLESAGNEIVTKDFY